MYDILQLNDMLLPELNDLADKLEIKVFDQYFSYGKRGYVDFGNQFAKLLSNSRKL